MAAERTSPRANIRQVRALLKEQLPLLRFMAGTTIELAQGLASGELVTSVAWNSMLWSAHDGAQEEAEFVWMEPREGRITWVCGLSIHPDSRETGMYEKCHEVIDAYLSPEAGYFETVEWYYGHANSKVYDMVDEATLIDAGLAKDVGKFLSNGIFIEPMPNEMEVAVMWEEVKAGF